MKHELSNQKVRHRLILDRYDIINLINLAASGDRSALSLKKALRDAKVDIPGSIQTSVHVDIPSGGDFSGQSFTLNDKDGLIITWESDK